MMNYKGYIGHVNYDDESKLFSGEVINTRDVITFQGTSVDELENAFRDSIDDYLEFCAERGEEPEKPYSGKFNLRLEPELHRQVAIEAGLAHKSLNAWVRDTLNKAVSRGHY